MFRTLVLCSAAWFVVAAATDTNAGAVKRAAAAARKSSLSIPPALPKPSLETDVKSDGAMIHVATFGESSRATLPVVVLHGGLGSSADMSNQITALAKTRYVIAIDTRAHGNSELVSKGIHYTQFADDAAAVLESLKIKRAAVFGWSDGGVTALELALRHPSRVAGLFVVGTNFHTSGMLGKGSPLVDEYFGHCRARWKAKGKQAKELMVALRKMWKQEPTLSTADLAKIDVPTVVALGDSDELVDRKHAQLLAKSVKKGRFVLLKKASHFAVWQDPKQVNDRLMEWLEELDGSAE